MTSDSPNLSALTPNPQNPRTITTAKTKMLAKALEKFGDLGGIVFNRQSGHLVGGHQRSAVFQEKDAQIHVTKHYEQPTKTGTVAEGYVLVNGDAFAYREVDWSPTIEKAASLAANKGAGEFDLSTVNDWLQDLSLESFDLDLTMFDDSERARLEPPSFEKLEEAPERLDEKKVKECPSCGYQF